MAYFKYDPNTMLLSGTWDDTFLMVLNNAGDFDFYRDHKPYSVGDMLDKFKEAFVGRDGYKFTRLWLELKNAQK